MSEPRTEPTGWQVATPATAPHLTLVPQYTDPVTGAVYVHQNLTLRRGDWEITEHLDPINSVEAFGDIASWCEYVKRFGAARGTLVAWSGTGLVGVLDYHRSNEDPGRCTWRATCPFTPSGEWTAWTKFADGQAHSQHDAVERLEDMAEDIVTPGPAELLSVLRVLRGQVRNSADTELRPDGTTDVRWSQAKTVAGGTQVHWVVLPASFDIAIPVLRGAMDRWQVTVRVRALVDDAAHLLLRFSLMNGERIWERFIAERVTEAQAALGEEFHLLRVAD